MTTNAALSELRKRIGQAMLGDQFRLRRSLNSLSRAASAKKSFDKGLKKLEEQLATSVDRRTKRLTQLPKVSLNEDLPIAARVDEITAAIREHQVIIVCGETGSGKSTQLPMMCLSAGRGVGGTIGHTQPRRIAARSVAARVAEELKTHVGGHVGFKIRFNDTTKPETYIKLMTDGILLAESQTDQFFNQYDTIIIDEAHERSLNIDFLMGRLKQILPKRKELRLIITSATIDAARFAAFFGTAEKLAPVINVEGRTFPVEMRYRPLVDDEDANQDNSTNGPGGAANKPKRRSEPDVQRAILDAVDELSAIDQGDILIFMPTERDIHETAKSLRGRLVGEQKRGRKTEVLPLYARLSNNDQNRIFNPGNDRRIVIATNVAESSLTVPGIRYVIDSGTARISRYSSRSRMQRLPIEPISRASADQRAGRCGRVAPGVCIRLYSEADFKQREQFTAPEIQRTNLASVILQTTALRLGRLEDFPFLEPPRTGTIVDGYRMLFELGALDEKNQLTEIGKKLSRLPVDPRVGRIVVAGDDEDCLNEILIIAAALEMQDPRERPIDQQQAADEKHAQFSDERSDFLSFLKLWDFYGQIRSNLSRGKLRKACQQNFLSYNRMREWVDIHHQLRELAEETGLKPKKRKLQFGTDGAVAKPAAVDAADEPRHRQRPKHKQTPHQEGFDPIHRALLAGFLGNVALLADKFEYTASGGQKVSVWPGSGLFKAKPKWIVAGELIETTKRYVRTVASIKPDWLEEVGGHLIKRTYSDPEWDSKAGSAMAFEKVTLFGLPVIPRRQVRYSRINAQRSREMLIQHGLVEGEIEIDLAFFFHNQKLLEELDGLQTRTRRYDLIADDEIRYEFYDQRIPQDVADAHQLRSWLKKAERTDRFILHMESETVRRDGTEEVTGQEFPVSLQVEQMKLPLEYNLEPGSPEDGVTISVPQEALNQLNQHRLGWLVPGLVEDKVVALIKSLPKSLRRQYVPAAETATEVIEQLTFGQHDFEDQVARILAKIGQQAVDRSDFQLDRLPNHLRMNVRVVDESGNTMASGRDVAQLRKDLGAVASQTFAKIDDSVWKRDGLNDWSFGELPAHVKLNRNGIQLTGYPSLIDNGDDVSMRLGDMAAKAAIETRAGIRRLAAIALRRFVKSQVDNLPQMNQWSMHAAAMGGGSLFRANLSDLVVDRSFFPEKGPYPRTAAAYQSQLKRARGLIPLAIQDVIAVMGPVMQGYADARKAINQTNSPMWKYAVDDAKQQMKFLSAPGFLTSVQWGWLRQFPRYFQAIANRLRKLAKSGVTRDQTALEEIATCLARYQQRHDEHAHRELVDPNLQYYRWMIEEYRVSLFAQELGTAVPVSSVRLEKQWGKVQD